MQHKSFMILYFKHFALSSYEWTQEMPILQKEATVFLTMFASMSTIKTSEVHKNKHI